MKTPTNLHNKEAKKFGKLVRQIIEDCHNDGEDTCVAINEILDIEEFYDLDFNPNLIELFEGWERGKTKYDKEWYYSGDDTILYSEYLSFTINKLVFPVKPKTLSDFISACDNSNIKLIFKGEE